MSWSPGDVIVERQVWHGQVVAGFPTIVIEDTDEHLVTYIPTGAPFGFVDEMAYPSPSGHHPWYGRAAWQDHGMLAVISKTDSVSVEHFWRGADRRFACWYLNIQEPMRATPIGFDSQDLELDIVIAADRTWSVKDDELLSQRVAEGRWTSDEAAAIRAIGRRLIDEHVAPERWWWDERWSMWAPDDTLPAPTLPDGWAEVPVA